MVNSKKVADSVGDLTAKGHVPKPVLSAIREKCFDCSGGSWSEVADCLVQSCALYPFRMGKNPWRTPMSEERRAAAAERFSRNKAGNGLSS